MKGSFDKLTNENDKEMVDKIVAKFHYRNGIKHPDGSMGTIKITSKQLHDCLAYAISNKE